MLEIKQIIKKLSNSHALTSQETENLFLRIMSGELTPAQISSILTSMALRGETINEIIGATRAMRNKATLIKAPSGAIDTCGTGGDNSGTLNISTAVSFVVAANGVPVAKHGNRKASSKSGTADVLEALGVNINASFETIEKTLNEVNIGFLFAQRHHLAMKYVAPVRNEIGIRTIFNLIGPLSNPANAKLQLIGVFDEKWLVPVAESLKKLGTKRAWVVHGNDGLDELTVTDSSQVAELKNGQINSFSLSPIDFGLPTHNPEELKGDDPIYNAKAIENLFKGEHGAFRNIVLLNSAAALLIAGKTESISEGIDLSAKTIDNGQAKEVLEKLRKLTHIK